MITFRSLLASEIRRCLSRRAVRVLVGLGLLMIVITGLIAFFAVQPSEVATSTDSSIARLRDLWLADGEGTLLPTVFLLIIGGLIGGALVVGGEWKAGTVVTLSTWEPRRLRLLSARLLASGLLAAGIAFALMVAYVVAILPTIFVNGTTDGIDGAFLTSLTGGVARSLSVIAFAAVLGACVASLGRNSTIAVAGLFAYNAIVEPTLRGVWPKRAGWLIGENIATWISFEKLDAPSARSPVLAGITLVVYMTVLIAVALGVFNRRDLAGAS